MTSKIDRPVCNMGRTMDGYDIDDRSTRVPLCGDTIFVAGTEICT